MKYTLEQNAISSLTIAIENFKKIYYRSEQYSESEIDEATKICLIFLENSIELLLKAILVVNDPTSIYEEPNSRRIRNAQSKVDDSHKLEDILISEGNFKTITYAETVKKYNRLYHNSIKVSTVLSRLGERRNAITHFGLDTSSKYDELIIEIINVFDVIYNYLYPQLAELSDIGRYFVSDDLIVDTIHGTKFLFDDDYVYNNIIDFLDELVYEGSHEFVCKARVANPNTNMQFFHEMLCKSINDKKFSRLISKYNVIFSFDTVDFMNNWMSFEIHQEEDFCDSVLSRYSYFFNVTAFCGECGIIYFVVDHNENKIFIYDDEAIWPEPDEPEPDYMWKNDCDNGLCKKYNLSKRNILLAFEQIFKRNCQSTDD